MKTCRHIRKKLSAYQDGEVGAAQKDAIESHLRTCKGCQLHYEAFQQTFQVLKRLPDIQADEGLSLRILDRVTQAQPSFWNGINGNYLKRLPVPATMVVAGILFGMLMGNFWIEQELGYRRTSAVYRSEPALTVVSVKAFDAAPFGSFSEGYLQLITHSPEMGHAE